jgi:hypothetical protein
MNVEWAKRKLRAFRSAASDCAKDAGADQSQYVIEMHQEQLYRSEPTARKIMHLLDPELARQLDINKIAGAASALPLIDQAIGILSDWDEVAVNLGPTAPTLAADQFHPWVWQAAQTLWDSKHYRMAVNAAATAISAHTQTKIGRNDISDDALMNQAFTEKPKAGQSYLRLPGDPSDLTLKSRNNALRPFAQGCFAGIRNPAHHEHGDDWDEQRALEQMAALSVLARWIDECTVLVGE